MFWAQLTSLMQTGNYRAVTSWKPWSAAVMVVVIIILSSVIAVIVTNLFVGVDLPLPGEGAQNAPASPAPVIGRRALLVVLFMQIAMVALTWISASAGPGPGPGTARDALALRQTALGPRTYLAAILVLFLWLAIYNALVWLFAYDQWQADLFKYNDVIFSQYWWIFALVVVVGAPLSEEFLFRGFLLPALGQSQLGYMGAAFVSSISWAALHWDYSTSGLIEIFLIGVYFSGLLWITGSLWVGIVCHGAYNLLLLLALRAFGPVG